MSRYIPDSQQMTPATLFDVAKRHMAARSTDPQTSHKAAAAAKINVGATAKFVYDLFHGRTPYAVPFPDSVKHPKNPERYRWTDDAIEVYAQECGVRFTPQSLRSARLVLYRLKLIEICGFSMTRRKNEAQLWAATTNRLDDKGNVIPGESDATHR